MLRLLTTADTEILAAAHAVRAARRRLPRGPRGEPGQRRRRRGVRRPARSAVVVRLLGGRRAWPEGVGDAARDLRARRHRADPARRRGRARTPSSRELSLAPAGAVAQAFEYLRHGGVENTRELLRFLADTFGLAGHGFEPPQELGDVGFYPAANPEPDGRPRVGVVFYRSHWATGNTAFIDALTQRDRGRRRPARLRCGRTRCAATRPRSQLLKDNVDALITTVLASGGSHAGDEWHAEALEALDVPVIQALCATTSRAALGRVRLRPLAARRRDAGRDPGVRRAHRRRADLLQGAARRPRRSRRCTTRRTPSAARGSRGLAVGHARLRTLDRARAAHRDRPVLLPHQARARGQRGRARHARQRDGPARGARARPATASSTTSPTATSSSTR